MQTLRVQVLRLLGDRQLVRLATRGDGRAFGAIYERHGRELLRYCHSLTGNSEDAADAFQNAMAAALVALPGERREIDLRPWLYRIAHNESISLLRARLPRSELADASDPATATLEHALEVRERLGSLLADLTQLPDRQRGALIMRELNGLRYGEIAIALDTTPAGARQAVYEARNALHQFELGRDMGCEAARRALSDKDRRRLRGRKLGAHLRECRSCAAFRDQLAARPTKLRSLIPVPFAVVMSGLAAGSLGSACVGAGVGGGAIVSVAGGAMGKLAGAAAVTATAATMVAGIGGAQLILRDEPQGARPPRDAAVARAAPVRRAAASPASASATPLRAHEARPPVARPPAAKRTSPPVEVRLRRPSVRTPAGIDEPVRRIVRRVKLPAADIPPPPKVELPVPARPDPATVYAQGMQQARQAMQMAQGAHAFAMGLTQQILAKVFGRPK